MSYSFLIPTEKFSFFQKVRGQSTAPPELFSIQVQFH